MSPFSIEEIKKLVKEINDISPEFMVWEDDGYYQSCIALKAKNYVLFDPTKKDPKKHKTVKGSAFKTSSKELAMKEMMQELVDEMLNDNRHEVLVEIYHKYVKEALNVVDIKRWTQKKTITESITDCEDYKIVEKNTFDKNDKPKIVTEYISKKGEKLRKNETDVWDAIKNEEDKQQGNKIYLYPTILGTITIPGGISEKTGKPLKDKVKEISGLKLDKYWNNDHDVEKLIKRCWDTLKIFKTVLDMNQYIDYTKSKNKHLLENFK